MGSIWKLNTWEAEVHRVPQVPGQSELENEGLAQKGKGDWEIAQW